LISVIFQVLEHNTFHHAPGQRKSGKFYRNEDGTSSTERLPHSDDEGELRSEEESDISDDKSSEEGEVSSELEEMELIGENSPAKEETPWERGLRLARERLERAKLLKAAEKDLAEKRMNLEVPTSAVDQELEKVTREDVFWPCYYQALIIGRTELTGHRFLPEDLLPPTAGETAEWRRGLDGGRHTHRQHRYRRATSQSSSSSASSSSRFSSPASSDGSSGCSSLASVAASWKATCAKAMKDYLDSPLGAKGRRGRYNHARWRRGQRGHSSRSSASSSRSSDSRSPSDMPRSRAVLTGHGHIAGKLATQGVRRMWPEDNHRSRRGQSRSNRSSSGSGSRSHSSRDSSDPSRRRSWNYRKCNFATAMHIQISNSNFYYGI
uniref:Cwf21 domain-containing protein n=1 Tax=Echinostoma caproni TaxID=27848 RepID=A0A183B4E6_9TREM